MNNPEIQVLHAIDAIEFAGQIEVEVRSSLYVSAPVGGIEQPDYVNAVCKIKTTLAPLQILHVLMNIEADMGRIRNKPRNYPREIDLDLLMYDKVEMSEPDLELPHPRMHERRFVLEPLVEIDRSLQVPGHGCVTQLLSRCLDQKVIKIRKG